jgi:hypothetical protein
MQRRNSITNFNSLLIWMCTNEYSDHKSKSGLFLKQIITSSNFQAEIQQKCKRKYIKKHKSENMPHMSRFHQKNPVGEL